MTATSAVSSTTSAFSTGAASFFSLYWARSTPALVSASVTAARIASLVMVAPLTASTATLWASTIAAGIFSTAGSLTPGCRCWR